jgi:hypothetical protein
MEVKARECFWRVKGSEKLAKKDLASSKSLVAIVSAVLVT